MNGDGQSDSPVVPAKPVNKAARGDAAWTRAEAESVEERGLAKGNTESAARSGHRAGIRVPRALDRVRQVARRDKDVRFTALLHHVNLDSLRSAYLALKRQVAPGVDGVTWEAYGGDLEANLQNLNWALDADVRDFFTSLDHGWLGKFLEHRIGDKRVLRLIQKWLDAGVIEDGAWAECDEGAPQGATVSPLPANVYLHYVFDLWVERWRRRDARGEMIVVRYADDFIVGFEHRDDAERFQAELSQRLAEFGLELKAEKTRLIEFGRFAAPNRAARGLGKPETFDFLGLTHICAKTRSGRFKLERITNARRMGAKLREVKAELRRCWHLPIPEVGQWLRSVVRGHLAYYAVPGNYEAVRAFRDQIKRLWWRALRRRSQRTNTTWERVQRLVDRWLPKPRVMHPYPEERFDARHPRQEPSAVVPHAGICAGDRP